MELEVILILMCIVLAAIAAYQTIRASKLKKEVGNQEFLVDAKNDIIECLNADKKMLKNINDATLVRKKELEDQVSILVTQVNNVGLKRGSNGRFVSAD